MAGIILITINRGDYIARHAQKAFKTVFTNNQSLFSWIPYLNDAYCLIGNVVLITGIDETLCYQN